MRKSKNSNNFKKIGYFAVVLFALSIFVLDDNAAFATSHNLSVSTQDDGGNALTGYWVVVSQNGVTVNSGFSTAEFTLAPGDYQVATGEFGGLFFNQWSDGTITREITITITTTNTVSLTAIYSTIPQGTILGPSIEVDSSYSGGAELSGIYVELLQNGAVIDQGFTPVAFAVTEGQSYTVSAEDFTNAFFNHWASSEITRTIAVTATASAVQLEAIYTPTVQPPPPIVGSSIEVDSSFSGGVALSGIYVQLTQNGLVVDEGFTPAIFEVTEGASYTVYAGDYIGAFLNHWSSGQITRTVAVTATASAVQLEAIYTTTVQPPPPGQIGPNSITVVSEFLDGTTTDINLYVQIRVGGSVMASGFTPVTFSNLDPGIEYAVVVYNDQDNWFRHYADGTLVRYQLVTPGTDPISLTAIYEKVPSAIEDKLNVIALDQFGNIIGDTIGSVDDGTLTVTPGMWMGIIPPGQTTPYTGGFTGSSSEPFSLVNGQTYDVEMNSYQQYVFSHWEDNGSTNPIRSFTMNGDIEVNAMYTNLT